MEDIEINKKRIIFFGSGDFPRETFIELIERKWEYEVVGLVTSYDKCEDNGKKLSDIASEHSIPFTIVRDCNDVMLEGWCKSLNPDIFVVISFKKIPSNLLTIVNGNAFNVHASLLPLLRGSNPIRWAIRNKFTETGLTAIELNDKIDCGRILDNIICHINVDDTYGTLKNRLSKMCPMFTVQVLSLYGTYTTIQQSNCGCKSNIFKAPKLGTSYFMIDDGEDLEAVLRSLLPYNGIRCTIYVSERCSSLDCFDRNCYVPIDKVKCTCYVPIDKVKCTVWMLHRAKEDENNKIPFSNITTEIPYIIDEIQIDGKKRMKIDEFVNGFKYTKPLKEDKGLKEKKYKVFVGF